jgi:muramoyltetrapeptide carboxypeptidase LdcA involved in peptidoglycan recycling
MHTIAQNPSYEHKVLTELNYKKKKADNFFFGYSDLVLV